MKGHGYYACRFCGCTEKRACTWDSMAGGPAVCSWVAPRLCSRCADAIVQAMWLRPGVLARELARVAVSVVEWDERPTCKAHIVRRLERRNLVMTRRSDRRGFARFAHSWMPTELGWRVLNMRRGFSWRGWPEVRNAPCAAHDARKVRAAIVIVERLGVPLHASALNRSFLVHHA